MDTLQVQHKDRLHVGNDDYLVIVDIADTRLIFKYPDAFKIAGWTERFGRRAKVWAGDLTAWRNTYSEMLDWESQGRIATAIAVEPPYFPPSKEAPSRTLTTGYLNVNAHQDQVVITVGAGHVLIPYGVALDFAGVLRFWARRAKRAFGETGKSLMTFTHLQDAQVNYNQLVAPNLRFTPSNELKGHVGGIR